MGLLQEVERVVDPQVLQEVLGVDRLAVAELEPAGDVGDHVDAGQLLQVDVDPAFEPGAAATDVEPGPRGPGGGGGGGRGHRRRNLGVSRGALSSPVLLFR